MSDVSKIKYRSTTWDVRDDAARSALSRTIDGKGKNFLNVFDASSGQSATINGVSWKVNDDGSVTANGTATANSFFYILGNNSNKVFSSESTIMTGCPTGGSETTYELQTARVGGAIHHDYGSGVVQDSGYSYRYVVLTVRNGYTANNLVFKPMICTENDYKISKDFISYTPSISELYAMIKALQS